MSDQPVSKPQHEDLSSSFAPNPKLGKLKPMARRRTEAAEPAPQAEAQRPQSPIAAAGETQNRPARTPRSEDPYARREMAVWVKDDLREELRRQVKAQEVTNGAVILAAIKSAHPVLRDLVAAESANQVVSGDLWDEIVPTTVVSTPRRQVRAVVTQQQIDVIDRLVREAGAESRSHLVNIALAHHFGREEQ